MQLWPLCAKLPESLPAQEHLQPEAALCMTFLREAEMAMRASDFNWKTAAQNKLGAKMKAVFKHHNATVSSKAASVHAQLRATFRATRQAGASSS